MIEAQLNGGFNVSETGESQCAFILEAIKPSKYIKLTKDKKGVKPKMKYYQKFVSSKLEFVICKFQLNFSK